MIILHRKINNRGMFFIEEDGNILAEMVYSDAGLHQMVIEHTQVGEELRGSDVGYELVHKAVDYAREHQLKIIPICPFAKSVFNKKPDFRDVLA
jgi:uncharacterized protein